jgi:predicted nucleic-acid-binding protein
MIAVDTNVIVRYLAGDDARQSPRARAAIDGNDVFIGTTVLLETEWVLRSRYGFEPHRLAAALRAFAGLPRVTLQNAAHVRQALHWMDGGLDFADALHLAGAGDCDGFLSFDTRFANAAKRLKAGDVRAP